MAPRGVAIQQMTTRMSLSQWTLPVARPMPRMAPTMAWEVLMGMRRAVMMVPVTAAATVQMRMVWMSCWTSPLRVCRPAWPWRIAPRMTASPQRMQARRKLMMREATAVPKQLAASLAPTVQPRNTPPLSGPKAAVGSMSGFPLGDDDAKSIADVFGAVADGGDVFNEVAEEYFLQVGQVAGEDGFDKFEFDLVGFAFELIDLADGDGGIGEVGEEFGDSVEEGFGAAAADGGKFEDAGLEGLGDGDVVGLEHLDGVFGLVGDFVHGFEQAEDVAAGLGEEGFAVHDAAGLVERMRTYFDVARLAFGDVVEKKSQYETMQQALRLEFEQNAHALGMYFNDGAFYVATIREVQAMDEVAPNHSQAWRALDVSVLHKLVLEKLLGIDEAALTAETNVEYVKDFGGATVSAMDQVDGGAFQGLFFMNPTRIEEVEAVARAGEKMPQKSTFFFPKIFSGLVVHRIGS